jgi:hypothetical protein
MKMIMEPERETPIVEDADVVVVGGGPAGLVAAIASARNGARTLLVERYGHLGGMATGGFVLLLDQFCDMEKQIIYGIPQEMVDRLVKLGGAVRPPESETFQRSEEILEKWDKFYFVWASRVKWSAMIDPEAMKSLANTMTEEEGVKLLLHSMAVGAAVENDRIKAVVLEGKSGRMAVSGKVVIDATGDGDVAAAAGAPFEEGRLPITVISRVGSVDVQKAIRFEQENPEQYRKLIADLTGTLSRDGVLFEPWSRTIHDNEVWFDCPTFQDLNALSVEDLTLVEIKARKYTGIILDYYKEKMPGFATSYVLDTAPQIGVRESRRIIGDYVLSEKDIKSRRKFEDVVARYASVFDPGYPFDIPYRCLVPKKIDNLLMTGRCVSSTHDALNHIRLIPSCMALGQAAGTAAALSVKTNVKPRDLNVVLLQEKLTSDGVRLDK